jgi:hypothetical protein
MRLTLLLIALLAFTASLTAQRVLLFEKLTDSRSERLYEGEMLRFKMKGDNFWQEGPIRQMRPDIQALVINDRFIMTDEITVIDQGNTVFAAGGLRTHDLWGGVVLLGGSGHRY